MGNLVEISEKYRGKSTLSVERAHFVVTSLQRINNTVNICNLLRVTAILSIHLQHQEVLVFV